MRTTREVSDNVGHSKARRGLALRIINDLGLIERWSAYGRPVVVGAVACDLIVRPDIDMEIYCPQLRIEDGFEVLKSCGLHPRVTKACFSNELEGRDQGLYWQLRYRHDDGEEWKIDMWSLPEDYDLPRGEDLVEAMRKALTPELRRYILALKEERERDPDLECPSIDLYRAAIDDGVRSVADLRRWLDNHETGMLSDWRPATAANKQPFPL